MKKLFFVMFTMTCFLTIRVSAQEQSNVILSNLEVSDIIDAQNDLIEGYVLEFYISDPTTLQYISFSVESANVDSNAGQNFSAQLEIVNEEGKYIIKHSGLPFPLINNRAEIYLDISPIPYYYEKKYSLQGVDQLGRSTNILSFERN